MKFIRGFGITSKPLTELLKKHSFSWNDNAQKAFEDLEVALCKAPILALSDFTKDIIVIGATSDSKKKLISVAHDSYIRSHVGIQNSYRRLKTLLY
jgi:type IV secretory pathway ATPase VirB11/archaellum biosynthesis ATPase